jgi:hypothetical protein
MRVQPGAKTVRRLLAADGFLDLGMPERAVAELESMEDPGMLEGPRQLLLGIALKQLHDFREAITHLEQAARLMPSPVRRFAWKELSDCYQAVGSSELATMATQLAGDGEWDLKITLPHLPASLNLLKTSRASEQSV